MNYISEIVEDSVQGSADSSCSWCPWKPFSTENLLLLYSKQRKMKWLEVMDVDEPALPALKKNKRVQAVMFQNARKLALYPENRETLNLSGYFVEKTAQQLEELIVHCNFMSDSRNAVESRELNDSATAPGLVSGAIEKASKHPNSLAARLYFLSFYFPSRNFRALPRGRSLLAAEFTTSEREHF